MRRSNAFLLRLILVLSLVCGLTVCLALGQPAQLLARLGLPIPSALNAAAPGGAQDPQGGAQNNGLTQDTIRQITDLVAEKDARTPAQQKIASQLLQAFRELQGQPMAANVPLDRANVDADPTTNRVKVDIDVFNNLQVERLIGKLEGQDASILFPSSEHRTIRAEINLADVEIIAGFEEVKSIQPAIRAITSRMSKSVASAFHPGEMFGPKLPAASPKPRSFAERAARVRGQLSSYLASRAALEPLTGTINAQGDRTHRADDVRNTFGYAGAGIKIGVLSDSYNALGGAAADVASGNLPGPGNPLGHLTPVTVLQDLAGGGLIDEGRAMLQIVHDLAPEAQLFFATAFVSQASFASNIVALRNAGCDIIIDDVFYTDEPTFQDGIIAQAVNTVTAGGALYFSSAGNEGSLAKGTSGYFEGDFNDAGSPAFTFPGGAKVGTIHNFGTMATPVNGDIITATGIDYTLTWADPQGASNNDYDLFLVSSGGVVKASSTNVQNGTQNPFERFFPLALAAGDRLVVFKSNTAAVRAFALNTFRGRLTVATTGQTHGHSAAVDAFSVGATPAGAPFSGITTPGPFPGAFTGANQVESFSSDGPRRMFFNANGTAITPGNFLFGTTGGAVRNKPDITAADGVSTTLPTTSGLNPFYGTSAAAPHAGAIAALIKSSNPALTPAQIRTILTTTAVDIEGAGYDINSGFGIVQAFQAMQAVAPTPMATINLGTVTFNEGSFSNGNGLLDPGEVGNLVVQLNNPSLANATSVSATLMTSTPGVTIVQGSANYGTIAASGSSSNTGTPFVIGLNSSVPCGTVIEFVLQVTFGGGLSPQFFQISLTSGVQPGSNLMGALGSPQASGPGFTSTTGAQTGRLNRNAPVSVCGTQKTPPILAAATGARRYDAYTFTNTNATSQCVTATMNAPNGINMYMVAYNNSGFIPATPNVNFLADQGSSSATQSFGFTAPAGQSFTLVIHEVNPGAAVGSSYTLNVSLSNCAAGPACTPVNITPASVASGATGTPYTQSFAATGGSGAYTFMLTGGLPAGLSFSGNTLSGTPTQAGSFPISITANDAAGCPGDTENYTLVIAGNAPASVLAAAGTPQSTLPGSPFATALQALVRDGSNNPLGGVNVTFTAPGAGASGTFPGGVTSVTVISNASGIATAPTFTANATQGSYVVTANVNAIAPANFNLSNTCPGTFVVTSNADSGSGTLREIINNLCAGATVTFDPSVTMITLTSGELLINKAITIQGPGADKLTISGNQLFRIFQIAAGTNTVSISGLTLRDGNPPNDSRTVGGGAILINNGVSAGAVNLTGLNITNNDASNTANPLGGGIDNEGGTVTIDRCAIVNNIATFRGGGIQNQGFGSMTITNSTIAGNTAGTTGIGGGIRSLLPLTLTNVTIFGNSAQTAGNVSRSGGTITFKNTIIAGGLLIGTGGTGPDISGAGFVSADYNLIQDPSTGTITGTTTHNITGVSPMLGPLQNNGGPTPTLAPLPGSPVIDQGSAAVSVDQRGFPRPIDAIGVADAMGGDGSDIGACEVQLPPTISKAFNPTTIVQGNTSTLSFTITNPNAGNTLTGVSFTDTLPGGVVVASPNGLTGACGGGTITATVGTGTISLTGATLAPSASCTFSVKVLGLTIGSKPNSVTVSSTNNGTGNTASATLDVVPVPPAPQSNTLTKLVPTDPLLCAGQIINGSFGQPNNTAVAQSGRVFAALQNLVPLPGSIACTLTPAAGGATTFCAIENGTPTWRGTLAAGQTVTITYQAQVVDNVSGNAQVCSTAQSQFPDVTGMISAAAPFCLALNCPSVGPGVQPPAAAAVSDQKPGSVLFYNFYTSNPANLTQQNSRINITNTDPARSVAVHLFFVDGASCTPADVFICLTPNQTMSFLASDIDPGTTGYIVAVAVDPVTGCPINFNFLIGDAFVKLASGHQANLGAEAFAALTGTPPVCSPSSLTATLNFDGVSYNQVPRVLAVDNFPSTADGNNTLVILNRVGGNLLSGASSIGSLFGVLFDEAEQPLSFTLNSSACQFRFPLTNSSLRTVQRLETVIGAGRTGWLRLWGVNDIGLLGSVINFNATAGVNNFNQGHNLHKLTFTNASLTIPIIPSACQ